MNELNLRAMIRQVLDETHLADPTDVTEAVFKRLKRGDYEVALRVTMRQFVRLVVMDQHVGERPNGSSGANRSWKRDAIRLELGGFRENLVTADGWKHLRDCTRDDLLFAANERRKKADENVAEAERLEKLAARLSGDQTVGDLIGGLDDDGGDES